MPRLDFPSAEPTTQVELAATRAKIFELQTRQKEISHQLFTLKGCEAMASLWEIFQPERQVSTMCFPDTYPPGCLGRPVVSFLGRQDEDRHRMRETIELVEQLRVKLHWLLFENCKWLIDASINAENWPDIAQMICPTEFPAWMARLERQQIHDSTPAVPQEADPKRI